MGLLAYQLLYLQLPLIVFPFPKEDFRYFSWVENTPSIGVYSYNGWLLTYFENQNYITRSILGEEDFYLISGQQNYDDTPRSYLRLINGNYKLLQLHFDRKFEHGSCSGGVFGFRDSTSALLKGYGSFTLPFVLNGSISASIYEDIINFSLNCDYLYFETTKDKWYGYLKLQDARLGVTGDDRQFASYLFRLRDPIFMVMVNAVGEGLFEGNFEIKDFFVAPIYVLSLDNSIYCVISQDLDSSIVGFKSKYVGLEVGKESCKLAVNSNILRAFGDYSYDDHSFVGVVEGTLKYSFYHKRITPGVQATYYYRPYDFANPEKFDFELSLKILEVEFFWEMTGITLDGLYEMQLWGMEMLFSF